MVKYLFIFIKKIILGFLVLYGYNMIGTNFNLIIPINFVTVTCVSLLGFPALFSLILLYVLIY